MATKIIHKKSSTAGSVPAASALEPGELAVNLADRKIYSKTTDGTVIEVGGGSSEPGSYSYASYHFTASANQTTFSGADDGGSLLSYTSGNVLVFLNGFLLEPTTDYAATNGSTVVMTSPLTSNDELTILALTEFSVGDFDPAGTAVALAIALG